MELLETITLAKNEEHLKIAAKEETSIAEGNIELVKNELEARILSPQYQPEIYSNVRHVSGGTDKTSTRDEAGR